MAVHGEHTEITLTAGADLSSGCQYKAIGVAGTIAANNSSAFGILRNKPKSGEFCSVSLSGKMKAYAGGALTAGNRVKVTTSGWIVAVASGDGSVGKALATCTSGSLVEIIADFANADTTY